MENTPETLVTVESVSIIANATPNPINKTRVMWQMVRFGIVGSINTLIDILVFNVLLFCLPTHDARMLLIYNSLAYTIGALNSYVMNKHWTFRHTIKVSGSEILRFACINICGVFCNNTLIWIATSLLRSEFSNAVVWANLSKIIAIVGTISISYLGMRLWVFASVVSHAKPRRAWLWRKEAPMKTQDSLQSVQQNFTLVEALSSDPLIERGNLLLNLEVENNE